MLKHKAILLTALTVFFINPALGAGKENSPLYSAEKYYYLTVEPVQGDNVLDQCAAGFHFAHVWEILNFQELTYDTELGLTTSESGNGPPAAEGWVRTGWNGPICEESPEAGGWTQAEERLGPVGALNSRMLFQETPPEERRAGWVFHDRPCWMPAPVWCVSD